MNKKYLNIPLEVKSYSNNGLVTGYASVFSIVDFHNEMLAPGAFTKSINNQYKQEVKFLWQHNVNEPIGIISYLEEDNYGLYMEAKLLLEISKAFEAYILIECSVRGLSIGYYPIEHHIDHYRNIRIINEVELKEISLVTFPANSNAIITSLK